MELTYVFLAAMWNGILMSLWQLFGVIGTIAAVIGIYNTFTKGTEE